MTLAMSLIPILDTKQWAIATVLLIFFVVLWLRAGAKFVRVLVMFLGLVTLAGALTLMGVIPHV